MLQNLLGMAIGLGITATLILTLASPLIAGLLMSYGRLRYRDWLAGSAFIVSLLFCGLMGDYLYNFVHMTVSRPSVPAFIGYSLLLCASPIFLGSVIWKNSIRKGIWSVLGIVLTVLVVAGIRRQFAARLDRDMGAVEKAMAPIESYDEIVFVPVVRHYSGTVGIHYLQGRVSRGWAVTLLNDPFAAKFDAHRCTGVTGGYRPKVSDPAVLSNVTKLQSLTGCRESDMYTAAVVGPSVKSYVVFPFRELPQQTQNAIQKSLTDKVLRINAFWLNGDRYVAVVTEGPSQDVESMNPNWTHWIFKIEGTNVVRLWPV